MLDFRKLSHLTAIVMFLVAGPALALPGHMYLIPDAGSFDCGEIFSVDLVIGGDITDLHGASVVLEFDDEVISPLSVTVGSLVAGATCPYFFDWMNAGAVGDSIAVDVANLGCAVSGWGPIVHLVFEGNVQGTATLRCRRARLRDSLNQPIPFVCNEAEIEYRCPVADVPVSWGAVKAIFR